MKSVVLLLALLLLGCTGVSPKNFSSVSSPSSFVLEKEYRWVAVKANAFHPDVVNGLAAGTYRAVFQDARFVYYQGPEKCVLPFPDNGGIRLPKPGINEKPVLWVYIRDDSEALKPANKGGVLVAQLSKLEAGRVRPFEGAHVDESLVASIKLRAQ